MIWILLYLVITIVTILVSYFDSKKYHHTIKEFLIGCLLAIILPPLSAMFLVNELIEFIKIKYPKIKISTYFITKFLNRKL
jgi:hypothetical protein